MDNAYTYFCSLKERRGTKGNIYSFKTRINHLMGLAAMYGFLCRMNFTKCNPWVIVRESLPTTKGAPTFRFKMFSKEEVQRIIAAPKGDAKQALRDRAMLAVFFGGGLRLSEVRNINIEHFYKSHEDFYCIYLPHTKNREVVHQSVNDWVAEPVKILVASRLQEGAKPSDPLFVSYKMEDYKYMPQGRISSKQIYNHFKKYAEKADIKGVSPHCARHTFVSHLKIQKFDDVDVARASRHKALSMVRNYDQRLFSPSDNVGRFLKYE